MADPVNLGNSYKIGGWERSFKNQRYFQPGKITKGSLGSPLQTLWYGKSGRWFDHAPKNTAGWTTQWRTTYPHKKGAVQQGNTSYNGQRGWWKTKQVPQYTAWNRTINQFINKNGTQVENPFWTNPIKQSSGFGRNAVSWVQTPWKSKASPIDPKTRALNDYGYLAAKKGADDLYAAGVKERELRSQSTADNYSDALAQLAQKKINDHRAINQKAARLGLGFSQGRLNNISNYNKNWELDKSARDVAYQSALKQIGAEDLAAKGVRDSTTAIGLNQATDKLMEQDRQADIGNIAGKVTYGIATPAYPHLDPMTGRAYKLGANGQKRFAPQ